MTPYGKYARPFAGSLALVLGLTLGTPQAFAAGPAPAPAPDPRPIATAAAKKVGALPAEALAQAAEPAPGAASIETDGKPFFKTTKGAVALVLLAGTIGYMGYSMSNDRVKSPAK